MKYIVMEFHSAAHSNNLDCTDLYVCDEEMLGLRISEFIASIRCPLDFEFDEPGVCGIRETADECLIWRVFKQL